MAMTINAEKEANGVILMTNIKIQWQWRNGKAWQQSNT